MAGLGLWSLIDNLRYSQTQWHENFIIYHLMVLGNASNLLRELENAEILFIILLFIDGKVS